MLLLDFICEFSYSILWAGEPTWLSTMLDPRSLLKLWPRRSKAWAASRWLSRYAWMVAFRTCLHVSCDSMDQRRGVAWLETFMHPRTCFPLFPFSLCPCCTSSATQCLLQFLTNPLPCEQMTNCTVAWHGAKTVRHLGPGAGQGNVQDYRCVFRWADLVPNQQCRHHARYASAPHEVRGLEGCHWCQPCWRFPLLPGPLLLLSFWSFLSFSVL